MIHKSMVTMVRNLIKYTPSVLFCFFLSSFNNFREEKYFRGDHYFLSTFLLFCMRKWLWCWSLYKTVNRILSKILMWRKKCTKRIMFNLLEVKFKKKKTGKVIALLGFYFFTYQFSSPYSSLQGLLMLNLKLIRKLNRIYIC